MTKAQLQASLTEKGISFKSKATKEELSSLLASVPVEEPKKDDSPFKGEW